MANVLLQEESVALRQIEEGEVNSLMDVDPRIAVPRIIASMRRDVLRGVRVTFIGHIPIASHAIELSSGIAFWAKEFGAQVYNTFMPELTHLVTTTGTSSEIQRASLLPGLHIVNQYWIYDSILKWKRMDEEPYRVRPRGKSLPEELNSKTTEHNTTEQYVFNK